MVTHILKSNRPAVIFFIICSAILLWLFSFIEPLAIPIPADHLSMPLYSVINENIQVNSTASLVGAFILVLLQAFLLIQFNKKYILINYRTYLPAFFYILISASFVQLHRLNPVIIGCLFIYIALHFIFSTYRNDYALNRVYLAGFFIAIASLIWAPFTAFILILFISLLVLRPFIGREWVVGILGFLTPFLFAFVYYFVFFDQHFNVLLENFKQSFELTKPAYVLHFSYYIFYGFLAFLIMIASYTVAANFQKKKIKTRKYFEINWWLFFISLLLLIFFKNVSFEILYVMSIPLAFLLTDFFYTIKRQWLLNVVLVILTGSVVYIQIVAH